MPLRNGMKGSAICVYDVDSLNTAFNSPFIHQKTKDSIWEPFNQPSETYKVNQVHLKIEIQLGLKVFLI